MSNDAQLVVLSVPSAKNDLVAGLVAPQPVPATAGAAPSRPDLVGELVGVLANRYNM